MPELPEVETVRRGLSPAMTGKVIDRLELRRPDLRFPFSEGLADMAKGKRIDALSRRSKYLLIHLDGDITLISHLGMSGSYRIIDEAAENTPGAFHHQRGKDETHDHVIFHLRGPEGRLRVIYNDPRRFGFLLLAQTSQLGEHPLIRDLGPEPVGNSLNAEYLASRFATKSQPLKSALLDQKLIAGLGNIYVCEALYRAGLSPKRQARTIVLKSGKPTKRLEDLTVAIRQVIAEAIEAGGSSLKDHIQTDGSMGYFQHNFAVYDRENEICRTEGCHTPIARLVQAGRSTFYCPRCQK